MLSWRARDLSKLNQSDFGTFRYGHIYFVLCVSVNADCTQIGCQNDGVCIAFAKRAFCKCPKWYSGRFCEIGTSVNSRSSIGVWLTYYASDENKVARIVGRATVSRLGNSLPFAGTRGYCALQFSPRGLISLNGKVGGPNKAHTLEKNAYNIQFHKD